LSDQKDVSGWIYGLYVSCKLATKEMEIWIVLPTRPIDLIPFDVFVSYKFINGDKRSSDPGWDDANPGGGSYAISDDIYTSRGSSRPAGMEAEARARQHEPEI
jgi:hypothetical protein